MTKGARLLAFTAGTTAVVPTEKKTTKVRSLLSNADGTCSYTVGDWVEPYSGGGLFEEGHYESVNNPTLIPCS